MCIKKAERSPDGDGREGTVVVDVYGEDICVEKKARAKARAKASEG